MSIRKVFFYGRYVLSIDRRSEQEMLDNLETSVTMAAIDTDLHLLGGKIKGEENDIGL